MRSLKNNQRKVKQELKYMEKWVKLEYKKHLQKAMEKAEEVQMNISIIKEMKSIQISDEKPLELLRDKTNALIRLLSSGQDKGLEKIIADLPPDMHTAIYEASINSMTELLIHNIQELITD
jgi:hypothetical protein